MSQEKTTLEVIAPTVEEAIQKGLAQLNLPQDAVDVEVLDAGSRGLFGLGSRQARIRLTIKPPQTVSSAAAAPAVRQSAPAVEAVPVPAAPAAEASTQTAPQSDTFGPSDEQLALEISQQVVSDLLEKMRVKAKVTASFRQPEADENEPVIVISVEGNDLSILIGRRSETLNALQYIASLIICKRLDRWTPIMIDVQGYRARRERQLRQLARRMAEQAIHTGRRQVLEPMPANERRLIHLELRDMPEVATESIGEEPNRKVTIFVKKDS